jgi:hypothetical protein
MPVTIEVAVTETESEKKAQLALAEIIGKNSDLVGSAVGTAATGLVSRSLAVSDIKTEPDAAAELAAELELARVRYYDALVAAKSGASGAGGADSQANLAAMKNRYNDARRSLGLEPIK